MRVAVVGNGAREHALARSLRQTADVVVSPGNAGMVRDALTCVPDLDAAGKVDLVVVGPEVPLVDGLADRLRAAGIPVFGPGAAGARLEGSKAWMKDVLRRANVPCAASRAFRLGQEEEAIEYLGTLGPPFVVKTDGLAAGKGVLVTEDRAKAVADLRDKLSGHSFGQAGTTVVIEEGMTGPELSVLAVCDGRPTPDGVVLLPPARDHKRSLDDDLGPNTGGMGAFSPVGGLPDQMGEIVVDKMIVPTLHRLRADGIDYRGVLYAGIMLTPDGPKIFEYNVRFGDPETQVVVPRLEGDLAQLLASAAAGRLDRSAVRVRRQHCVGVVLASPGYELDPSVPRTGRAISGVEAAEAAGGILHWAGVSGTPDSLVTAGGRVVCVSALGEDGPSARATAYRAADELHFEGGLHRRNDIAASA
jgi:phosphoribosylamine--glycine ligase